MKTCKHPKIAKQLMENFLNSACDLGTYNADGEFDPIYITMIRGDEFSAEIVSDIDDCEELEIEYNFNSLDDEGAKLFRKYWTDKVPMLKGFSTIVLTLLHELGHLETQEAIRKEFSREMRDVVWAIIDMSCDTNAEKNLRYFAMPDETAATEWAIKWLSDADHRKRAKAFEAKFFKCFA